MRRTVDAAYGAAVNRQDKNIYQQYGLDVQLILVNSGSLAAQIFQAGEIRITANAPGSLVSLAATGEKPQRSSTAAGSSVWTARSFLTLCIAKIVSGTFGR